MTETNLPETSPADADTGAAFAVTSSAAIGDQQFAQLASLMTRTLRLLAAGSSPPMVLRSAKASGALAKRHLGVLLTITFAGPLSVSELAAALVLGLPATSTLVAELSRAGLVARSEDDADHRRTIVRLDERHREQITTWAFETLAPLRRTLDRLRPEGRELFIEGWRILNEEARAASESRRAVAADADGDGNGNGNGNGAA